MEKSVPMVLSDVFSLGQAVVMGMGEGGPQRWRAMLTRSHGIRGTHIPSMDTVAEHVDLLQLAEVGCGGLVHACSVMSNSLQPHGL